MMGYRGYGYGSMMDGGWFVGLMMLFFFTVVIAGIVLLVIWAVRASSGGHAAAGGAAQHPGVAGHHEAVAIAKKRLASGEITKEQYDEIMRTLGG
jgi:uncharacterized membrane protein